MRKRTFTTSKRRKHETLKLQKRDQVNRLYLQLGNRPIPDPIKPEGIEKMKPPVAKAAKWQRSPKIALDTRIPRCHDSSGIGPY